MSSILVENDRRFKRAYCLHYQGDKPCAKKWARPGTRQNLRRTNRVGDWAGTPDSSVNFHQITHIEGKSEVHGKRNVGTCVTDAGYESHELGTGTSDGFCEHGDEQSGKLQPTEHRFKNYSTMQNRA